jgi:LytS/YehU family sensor histidine kinase
MDVWLDCIKNVAAIILLSYPLSKFSQVTRAFFLTPTLKDCWILALFFGLLSILSMLLGAEIFNGALLDSRNVAPTVGGILAGPMVGIIAGCIGAIYRFLIGGFTAVPDAISLPLCGLLGGFIYEKYGHRRFTFYIPFLIGFAAELLHNGLILLMARPFILAESLIGWSGLATIVVNGLGVVFFINLLRDIQYSQYVTGASYAVKAFAIAEQTLPIIAEELDADTADKLADIIYREALVDAVSIAVNDKIMAFHGKGEEHHLAGEDASYSAANKHEVFHGLFHCTASHCPLKTVITAPLTNGSNQIGTLEVYKVQDVVYSPDVKMVSSIARLLSMQFINARAARRESLLVRAEFEALRAQIHPHFLFNALSAIKVLIREEPRWAQDLLVKLAQYLRRSFHESPDLIAFAEEIKGVEFYLEIQKARFGQRLQVSFAIEQEATNVLFPPFALQPLVENALNHGFVDKGGLMKLSVQASLQGQDLIVEVMDNGCGVATEVIAAVKKNRPISSMGIGLTNIHRRLRILYGSNYDFYLENVYEGTGTRVVLRIPQSIAVGVRK